MDHKTACFHSAHTAITRWRRAGHSLSTHVICALYEETQYAASGNTQKTYFEGTEQASDNEVSPELLNVKFKTSMVLTC